LQAFGDRMWSFAVPILFMNVWSQTLLPSALFSFFLYSLGTCLMPYVGRWMDRTDRLRVMTISIFGQNLAVLVNLALFWCIYVQSGEGAEYPVWNTPLVLLFAVLLLTTAFAEMMGSISTMALEKDWLLVMVGNSSAGTRALTAANTQLRRIDLLTKIVAPAVFGLVVQSCGSKRQQIIFGLLVVAVYNLLSAYPQYYAVQRLFAYYPALQHREQVAAAAAKKQRGACSVYISHPVFLASFAYSMIYLTVLDNGTLMTAYLQWVGVPAGLLGLGRGVGAAFGILGSLMFQPILNSAVMGGSLRRMGVTSIVLFFLSICPAAVVFHPSWFGDDGMPPLTVGWVMLGAVAVARVWLWSFDLAHTQVLQEEVEEHLRGVINSSQTACYQWFYVVLAVLGIVFSHPSQFQVLTLVSVGSVGTAAVLWTAWTLTCGAKAAADRDSGYYDDKY